MRVSWCDFGGADFFRFFCSFFLPSNAHGVLQVRGHLASCTSLLVLLYGWAGGSVGSLKKGEKMKRCLFYTRKYWWYIFPPHCSSDAYKNSSTTREVPRFEAPTVCCCCGFGASPADELVVLAPPSSCRTGGRKCI